MDFTLPFLAASFFVGSIGFVMFHYGRKCSRMPQLVGGLALMIFPGFLPGIGWMLGAAATILAATWGCLRAGM
jgi:hypothetical protein